MKKKIHMFRISKAFIIILSLLAGLSCQTKQPITVTHVTQLETGHNRQGFFYSLPRNVVTVEVVIVKTESIPGPFAQYAGKYLSLDAVIERPSTHYSINDVTINTFAEADPAQFYFVEYNGEKNNPFTIVLNEGGTISAVNIQQELDESVRHSTRKNIEGYFGTESTFNHLMETNLQEKIDTILERVRMDTVTIERKTLRRTWVEKTSEVRAKEVADYILNIRNKRFEIISGFAEIPYSREALQYMNEQLEQQENDYLELFTGITTHSAIKYRYSIIPDKETAGTPTVLFYFDKRRGLLEQPHSTTEELKITISRDFATREMSPFAIIPTDKSPSTGFYYRIPEHGNIVVSLDEKTIAEARLLISQFGVINNLPAEDFLIEFHPHTGTIRSIEKKED